jgi:hypothetical protein
MSDKDAGPPRAAIDSSKKRKKEENDPEDYEHSASWFKCETGMSIFSLLQQNIIPYTYTHVTNHSAILVTLSTLSTIGLVICIIVVTTRF